jgi:hypothetical protein
LETRVVLSHLGLGHAALVHPIHYFTAPVSVNHLSLNGTVSGTFVTTITASSNLAGGTTTTFQGTGTVSGLGQVTVTGLLTTSINATGVRSTVETFTFTTVQGSVTIQVSKPATTLTSPTDQSSFTIVAASGMFKGATGSGTASLKTITEAVSTVPPTVARGTFTLTLKSNPTVV